jgi:hypothetical protein
MLLDCSLRAEGGRSHFTLPYRANVTPSFNGPDNSEDASVPVKPTPPPEIVSRADFRAGNRLSFTHQNLRHRVGLIVRIKECTATLACDGQAKTPVDRLLPRKTACVSATRLR